MAKLRVVTALAICALVAAGPSSAQQASTDAIGEVVTVQGSATATRRGAAVALKVSDAIFRNDVVQTGRDGALGITFNDESTFNLTGNARMAINEFVYQEGGRGSALFNIGRGNVAFVASQIAKTGDMKVATPTSTLGIRGTTGLVEIPEGTGPDQARIKLYPDANGRVGRIEVFNLDGARLGVLSQGATAFAIRSVGGRFAAVPFQIPPQEAARDRNAVRQLHTTHNTGRQIIQQKRQLRQPGQLRPGQRQLQKQPGQQLQQPAQQKAPARQQQPALQKQPALQQQPAQPRQAPLVPRNTPGRPPR